MIFLAWTAFLEPLPIQGGLWWLLICPLIIGICMAYKAVYCPDLSRYWFQTWRMSVHVLLVMILLWAALQLVVRVVIPALPVG